MSNQLRPAGPSGTTGFADGPRLLIIAYRQDRAVRELAERIAEGARCVTGVTVHFLDLQDRRDAELRPVETERGRALRQALVAAEVASADALIFGVPDSFRSTASPLTRFLEDLVAYDASTVPDPLPSRRDPLFGDKVGASFISLSTQQGGNDFTWQSIGTTLLQLGMIVVGSGAPQAISQTEAGRALGQRVAEAATWLRLGRAEDEKQRLRDVAAD